MLIIIIFIGNLSVYSQETIENQIKEIRKDYVEITSNINNYQKKEAFYTNDQAYWMNTAYTGYLNDVNKLVYLTYEYGEEGYGATIHYYFKNKKIIFMFIESIDPDGNKTQERIYFWDDKIIKALIKEKNNADKRPFSEISNKKNEELWQDIDQSSKIKLSGVEQDRTQFFSALKKE
ncbi:MAG: hypothetical protein DRI95_03840 [Bacteroidetes bacterium]|nr:MAG: hypothetical protein DRI95_03840 [Bacteroidota bacterium]